MNEISLVKLTLLVFAVCLTYLIGLFSKLEEQKGANSSESKKT